MGCVQSTINQKGHSRTRKTCYQTGYGTEKYDTSFAAIRPNNKCISKENGKANGKAFSDYFTSTITQAMLQNPQRDVTTIEVDLKLSTLKPMHGKLMITVHDFLRKEQGKQIILSGWRAAGITEAIKKARSTGVVPSLDPFA